jgi:hypothetical protein
VNFSSCSLTGFHFGGVQHDGHFLDRVERIGFRLSVCWFLGPWSRYHAGLRLAVPNPIILVWTERYLNAGCHRAVTLLRLLSKG